MAKLFVLGLLCIGLGFSPSAFSERCLFISSYHQGYPWADGIERGVRQTLAGRCELHQINMDTKRQQEPALIQRKALEIKQFIERWQPDVVIAADDNASKYVVVPYLKNTAIPVVFCGINWTVDEYGYPYKNVTGMVEVAPIHELFEQIHHILPQAVRGSYIAANTLTEHKSYQRFQRIAMKAGIVLDKRLASSQAQWNQYFRDAQRHDFIILGTESGIRDWDKASARRVVDEYGRVLSLTVYEWMVKFATLGMHKIAFEQGEWAAKVAMEILDGASPQSIPIIPNQEWELVINARLLANLSIELPELVLVRGKLLYEK